MIRIRSLFHALLGLLRRRSGAPDVVTPIPANPKLARLAAWTLANPEQAAESIRQGARRWKARNRQHCREYQQSWLDANRESVNAYNLQHYRANREAINERRRTRYAARRESKERESA